MNNSGRPFYFVLSLLIGILILTPLQSGVFAKINFPIISFDSHPELGMIALIEEGENTRLVEIEKDGDKFNTKPMPIPAENLVKVCIAELTGDDKPDLLFKKLTFGEAMYSQLVFSQNLGDGNWEELILFQHQPSTTLPAKNSVVYTTNFASGDLNSDGKPDLVFVVSDEVNEFDSTILFSLNLGKGRFGPPALFPQQDKKAKCVAIGDVNFDGKGDLIYTWDEGWFQTNSQRGYETASAMMIVENKGKLQFDKPRGLVRLMNLLYGFEDVAYDPNQCPDPPHLIMLYKTHPSYKNVKKGNLIVYKSNHVVLIPTLKKETITWKNTGVTRNFDFYVKSTPWEFDQGREPEIVKDF